MARFRSVLRLVIGDFPSAADKIIAYNDGQNPRGEIMRYSLKRVEELFLRAIEFYSQEERVDFVRRECGIDWICSSQKQLDRTTMIQPR